MNNNIKSCTHCHEHFFEVDMFRMNVKTGKYLKRCYNCRGRTCKEIKESMIKIFGNDDLENMIKMRNTV